jgi:hypothetical protein
MIPVVEVSLSAPTTGHSDEVPAADRSRRHYLA